MLRIGDPNSGPRGGWRLQNVTKYPNLVGGDPEGVSSRLRCICAWGGAPSPLAPRSRGLPTRKQAKSHSDPLQPRPTHTPSRRCAPCSLACFHFFFRELPLLTRPHLTFETAGKSAFSSPYDVSVAAARQDICTISRQLNRPCCCHPIRLVPGSIPALADRCSKKRLWSVPRPYLHLS